MKQRKRTIKKKHKNTRRKTNNGRRRRTRRINPNLRRKTMNMRGGMEAGIKVLKKAANAVREGLLGTSTTQPATPPERKISHVPMPNHFTRVEYEQMILFQQRFIKSIKDIKISKTKPPNYTAILKLLEDIVNFNRGFPGDKHYNFLIGYDPSVTTDYGLQTIDFSRGNNQLPLVIKLYIESAVFKTDLITEKSIDDAKQIESDIFSVYEYNDGIAKNSLYNYNPTLIDMLDAIYYCIPDQTICLELTEKLHKIDPHIVERINPLTWTTPLCRAISLNNDKLIFALMELIKSNQNTGKALFHYSKDSYYPMIDDDAFREICIKLIKDRVDSAKMFVIMQGGRMLSVGTMTNLDGSQHQVISVALEVHFLHDMLSIFWEKYRNYIIKYCGESEQLNLPLNISQWLGDGLSGYIAKINEKEKLQNMSEAELLALLESDAPSKVIKKTPKQQPQQQQKQPPLQPKTGKQAKLPAEDPEKEKLRIEQARLREEAEIRKKEAAEAEADRKRIAAEAEAERKRVADEEKKVAKAAKKTQKRAEEAAAAAAAALAAEALAAEAEEARAKEKERLSARTPPFLEPESEKYSKMEEGSQETSGALQIPSMAGPVAPMSIGPDLSGLRRIGVNPDVITEMTISLLLPYVDSGNIDGVCQLITSQITNYTLKKDMYYNFKSCVIFIVVGQLTNLLLQTTKYRLILKGSKALQVAFINEIDTKSFLISDDIDILLVAADQEDFKKNPMMYQDSGVVAGDICSMIEWIIKSVLPPGLISVLNPMKQRAKNQNVFKISHVESTGILSVIADIDIIYTKSASMELSSEDWFLSQQTPTFPMMSAYQSFDVFYNRDRMVDTTISISNIQLVYSHQKIDTALEEKIYYYIKYILLKTPSNDYTFLLDKFKKSIIAILKYNYFMIPEKGRGKFINYSEWYIPTFLSDTPLQEFASLVVNELFPDIPHKNAGKG